MGVVDIGSNSVRLVVFDGAARSPAYFYNEKIMCALGAGMSETGNLNPEGRRKGAGRAETLPAYAGRQGMGTGPLTMVATAAVREAELTARISAPRSNGMTGVKVWVIDGREEARLSAQGVLLGWPGSYGLVCDIGGSSMELAEINGGHVGKRVTSASGPAETARHQGGQTRPQGAYRWKRWAPCMPKWARRTTGCSWWADRGGRLPRSTWNGAAIRCMCCMNTACPPRRCAKPRSISRSAISKNCARVPVFPPARMALVPHAAELLREIVKTFKPRDIAISSYGIREGLLYEQMPQQLRDRDPLIEACRFAEAKDARVRGFGKVVYNFISRCSTTRKARKSGA